MCNLSQGIKEEGIAIGREEGREEEREAAIRILIEDNLEEGVSEKRILEKLKRRYALSEEAAEEWIRRVMGK